MDNRKTIVTFHSNSNAPRSKRWYRVSEATEYDGDLFMHILYAQKTPAQAGTICYSTKPDAVQAAKIYAEQNNRPYLPGLYSSEYGKPLERLT